MPINTINQCNPLVGLGPLYEAAAELLMVEVDDAKFEEVRTRVEPVLSEGLAFMEYQLNLLNPLPEHRVDYGLVHCVVPHCLVVYEKDESMFFNPRVADSGTPYLLSGWVTGMMFGHDFELSMAENGIIPDVRSGIWVGLSTNIPETSRYVHTGALIQLPYAKLYNPSSLAN